MTMQDPDLLAASARIALAAYKTQYCPFQTTDKGGKNGYHSHVHAAYTGLAFDLVEQTAPDLIRGDMFPFVNRDQLQADHSQATDSLINAAAAHHRTDTFRLYRVPPWRANTSRRPA